MYKNSVFLYFVDLETKNEGIKYKSIWKRNQKSPNLCLSSVWIKSSRVDQKPAIWCFFLTRKFSSDLWAFTSIYFIHRGPVIIAHILLVWTQKTKIGTEKRNFREIIINGKECKCIKHKLRVSIESEKTRRQKSGDKTRRRSWMQ